MSGIVSMRSALATIFLDSTPPRITVVSEERVEWPDAIDFVVSSDKPIADRSYAFVDNGGTTYRLGWSEEADGVDRVSLPSAELAEGRGVLFITLRDDVGNEQRAHQQVAVIAPKPYDAAVGLQKVIIGVTAHRPVYWAVTGSEEAP